jgi:hypothetical protein
LPSTLDPVTVYSPAIDEAVSVGLTDGVAAVFAFETGALFSEVADLEPPHDNPIKTKRHMAAAKDKMLFEFFTKFSPEDMVLTNEC